MLYLKKEVLTSQRPLHSLSRIVESTISWSNKIGPLKSFISSKEKIVKTEVLLNLIKIIRVAAVLPSRI